MFGQLITKWTIRLALACYVTYMALTFAGEAHSGDARGWQRARAIWTLGCVLFVVHVACAFHFYHHWSHAAAWQNTAARTESLLGVAVGDGVYFSYLFLVLWIADVAWLWLVPTRFDEWPFDKRPDGRPQSPATADASGMPAGRIQRLTPPWRSLVHVFLAFIAINGAVVFESGPTRNAGLAALAGLCCLAIWRGYNRCGSHAAVVPQNCPPTAEKIAR